MTTTAATMNSSSSSAAALPARYHMDKFFKFPQDIRNDIIYCQRALKSHIKVHQMVLDHFQPQLCAASTSIQFPQERKRILDEIESEIYEINAEQHFLLLRLRRVIDEFGKKVRKTGLVPDKDAINVLVSNEVVPRINNDGLRIRPVTVQLRDSEAQLIQKYFGGRAPKRGSNNNSNNNNSNNNNSNNGKNNNNNNNNNNNHHSISNNNNTHHSNNNNNGDEIVFEIMDSEDDNDDDDDEDHKLVIAEDGLMLADQPLAEDQHLLNGAKGGNNNNNNNNNGHNGFNQQMSLLKPIAQRLQGQCNGNGNAGAAGGGSALIDSNKPNILLNLHRTEASNAKLSSSAPPSTATAGASSTAAQEPLQLAVSKNVKMSRLNLRQALKKARTETLAANAAGKFFPNSLLAAPLAMPSLVAMTAASSSSASSSAPTKAARPLPPPPPPPPLPAGASSGVAGRHTARHESGGAASGPSKKAEPKGRSTRTSAAAAAAAVALAAVRAAAEAHTSSDDSNGGGEREAGGSPTQAMNWPYEPEEVRTLPAEYGQEMFLRFFQLYTPEAQAQMQQRRSKRKRRQVHSNERADFHYGRIEYGSFPPPEDNKKKRKAFLLSPQVKRGLQTTTTTAGAGAAAKRPKRSSADKPALDEVSPPSRSSSSSPDEKRACNECLKSGGGFIDKCEDCKGCYHQSCHREVDEPQADNLKKLAAEMKVKLCPACKRAQEKVAVKIAVKKEEIKAELLPFSAVVDLTPTPVDPHNEAVAIAVALTDTVQYKTLHSTAKDLQQQLVREKARRASLQQESKLHKINMHQLLNIVNTIKTEEEHLDEEECVEDVEEVPTVTILDDEHDDDDDYDDGDVGDDDEEINDDVVVVANLAAERQLHHVDDDEVEEDPHKSD